MLKVLIFYSIIIASLTSFAWVYFFKSSVVKFMVFFKDSDSPKSKNTNAMFLAESVIMVRSLSLVGEPKTPFSSRKTGNPSMFNKPRPMP
jgi:hypothetical protein